MLVIFDCDGVLVDSEPLSNAALVLVLAGIGVELSVEDATAEFMGRSWTDCLTRIGERLGAPVPAGFTGDYVARRDGAFRRALRPVPGVEAALDAIGAPDCVASSGDLDKMRLTLGLTGLLERFDGRLFSATEVENGKPAPDLFLHAAARLGFEPAECVVIEDAPVGVAAARAAGMRVLGFAGRTDAALLAGADEVFSDMAELPHLVSPVTPPGCAPR
jgi:HAD superfamily hydrolase (TIGR01509 family)